MTGGRCTDSLRLVRPPIVSFAAVVAAACLLPAGIASAAPAALLTPDRDPFYAAPANLVDFKPGEPIRVRDREIRGSGTGKMYPAKQVLYRSTDANQRPIATVATVIMPLAPKPGAGGKLNLVSYQGAYDGLGPKCRPSYTMQQTKGTFTGDVGSVEPNLQQGWAVVAADHEGPNDAWMSGYIAGHTTLDGIRAAQALPGLGLAGSKVGLQGYSGGGHATAWANELAAEYAPELGLVGAVQGGVPADPELLYRSLNGSLFAGVMLAAIQGISRSEPSINVRRYLNPLGLTAWNHIRKACIGDFMVSFPFVRSSLVTTVNDIFKVPEIKAAAVKNTLGQRPPSVPTWMFHAHADELVGYRGASNAAKRYCEQGATLRFTTYKQGEHITAALQSAPYQLRYLRDRFEGKPAPNTC